MNDPGMDQLEAAVFIELRQASRDCTRGLFADAARRLRAAALILDAMQKSADKVP